MFFAYYVLVALFTFWAVSTHAATRGKPLVALLSAMVMPFALPLIPVVGLVALAYQSVKGKKQEQAALALLNEQQSIIANTTQELLELLKEDERVEQAVWSLAFMEGTYEQDEEVLRKVERCLEVMRKIVAITGENGREVLAKTWNKLNNERAMGQA
jgi:hypothetical protein